MGKTDIKWISMDTKRQSDMHQAWASGNHADGTPVVEVMHTSASRPGVLA
ncbi:hypothetical protein GLAREA_11638 [Glarea lozoyensis ATCC 20868]|uniref:Uncharacterized protein n=1 Tax=Glarea lozoyensis (strain ATCC 20868 / MF5171) TaxID=1116229 RepID=S3CEY4_GLAL2|nr:uncharacterized protein GLAREA_11638 [Glarea lozoyensis ATCC 20868]EPE25057.1 hypothetical protein GLAREA_11638 [Glarea lozoyensis ATCC 20868]